MYKNRQQLEQVANAAQVSLADILDAGFDSLEALAAADNEDLMRIRGVDEDTVGILRTAINLLSPKVQPRDDEAESGSTLQE
jgi:N utilization substance protein A